MTLVFDLESDGLLGQLTKIHCICLHDTESGESWDCGPEEVEWAVKKLQDANEICGHNIINFDIPAIQKIYPWFQKDILQVQDTLVWARLIWTDIKDRDFRRIKSGKEFPKNLIGRHSLEAYGHRLGVYKGDFGKTTDWSVFTPEMLSYCSQDVVVTTQLLEEIRKLNYSEQAGRLEHQVAALIDRQVSRGVFFDVEGAKALYADLAGKRAELEASLTGLFPGWHVEMKTPEYWEAQVYRQTFRADTKREALKLAKAAAKAVGMKIKDIVVEPGPMARKHIPFNPGSRDHIARALTEKYGWEPKAFTECGKAAIDENVLGALDYPEAQRLSDYFKTTKVIAMVAEGNSAWLKLESKGRIHGRVDTNGARTGRMTHSKPNAAQVPAVSRNKNKEILYGLEGGYGFECRSLWRPTPGMVLVGADAAGLELRCLGHYLAHWDGGKYVDTLINGDIHTATQQAAGLETRDDAKRMCYLTLYGGSAKRLSEVAKIPIGKAKNMQKRFTKAIRGLEQLISACKKAHNERGYLKGLDGRKLWSVSEHSALNTLLQGAGAIIMKQALAIFDRTLQEAGLVPIKDYCQVLNVHDEVQTECLPQHAEFIGKACVAAIEEAGKVLGFQCPLTGEYKIGASWAETH